jgi:hypothetical protein
LDTADNAIITWNNAPGDHLTAADALGPMGFFTTVSGAISPYWYQKGSPQRFWGVHDLYPPACWRENAVGYVAVIVPAGKLALLANPLDRPPNTLPVILQNVPVGTVVYAYSSSLGSFGMATKRTRLWTGSVANDLFPPGKAFFVRNIGASDLRIAFVGDVPQGGTEDALMKIEYPGGFSLVASIVPQAGKIETDLMLPAKNNDRVFRWNIDTQSYAPTATRRASSWTPGEPSVAVAEGFFFLTGAAGVWARSFSPFW